MATAKLREKEPATAFLFCRHGATDYPEDRFYSDQPVEGIEGGPGLSTQGKLQAQRLGGYLAGLEKLEVIYTSSTLRTRQTTEAIIQFRDVTVGVLPDLVERRMGQWEGCSAEEIQQRDPDGWRRWKTDPLLFSPPGGESLLDFSQRITKAVGMILEKEIGRTAAVVTHVGTIRVATAQALGIPLENSKRLVVAPGSVTRIHYTKSWPNLVLFGYQP